MCMNPLIGKIIIEGKITLKTGMHIGAGNEFASIGSVDSVIVRDAITKRPYIPGSSLKGKMRYLLSKVYATDGKMPKIEEESIEISRLFGQSGNKIIMSRLQFFDVFMNEESVKNIEKLDTDLYLTEVKYENTINRITAVANPRQIERAIAGSVFDFKLCYNIESERDIQEDMKNIGMSISLLEDDYIGGHGTRGYGRIAFSDFKLNYKGYTKTDKNLLNIAEKAFFEGKEGR